MFVLITIAADPLRQLVTEYFVEPYQLGLRMSLALARDADESRRLQKWMEQAVLGDVLDLGGRFVITYAKAMRTTNVA